MPEGIILPILTVIGSVGLAYLSSIFAIRQERARLEEELKLEMSIERALTQLLSEQGWALRSFDNIKHHVRGFEEDQLRQYLVRSGALAFEDTDGSEWWGLLDRNLDRLKKKKAVGN